MNPAKLPNVVTFLIGIIVIVSQVSNTIEVDTNFYNDSIFATNNTDHSPYLSRRYKRQNINIDHSCEMPNYPNSAYEIVNYPEEMYKPGDYAKKHSILEITCHRGYKLPPLTANPFVCLNGRWNNEPPACLRTCPSLRSTTSTTVQCKYGGTPLDNCIHPIDGTDVHLSCNTFYEADTINRNPTRTCQNGRWGPISLSECYATCGLKTPKGQSNIINGGIATPGDYPWHVGIYDKTKMFLCGGSIIDQNIILSAAHCLADYGGKAYPADSFLIGAGKYHRSYDDNRDAFPQYSTIRKIFIPNRYKSINGLNGFDIAVVILENPFTLTTGVQPVCVALNEEFQDTNYFINNNGTVIGWGYTQEGSNLSDVLKELIIPYVQFDKCYNEVPKNFQRYIMFDKICGGYLNQGTSVCQGDSGGGLIYNINNHYFVKGIVSTSPSSLDSGVTQCNSHQYGLYTSVDHHIHFVRDIITRYGWKEFIECTRDDCTKDEDLKSKDRLYFVDGCRLPSYPLHGKFILPNKNTKYESGNFVLTGSVILLTCDPGYQANPSGGIYFSCVDKGNWHPAVGSCTAMLSTHHGNVPNNQFELNDQNFEEEKEEEFNNFDIGLMSMFDKSSINYLISPLIIKRTLFMLLEGSKGKSAQEIIKALRIPVNVTTSGGTINNILNSLSPKSGSQTLEVATVIAVPDNYTLLPEYAEILEEYYKTKLFSGIFGITLLKDSLPPLSNWVRKTSNSWISKIIQAENINNESSLVIANALFYYPKFKIKFEQYVPVKFENGKQAYTILATQVISQFRYRYFEEVEAQIIELPFIDEEFAMLIFLPYGNQTVDLLQKDLKHISFPMLTASLTTTNVLVSLSEFNIEYSAKLGSKLKRMGIREIFSENANLNGIVDAGKIKVNDILHIAKIRYDHRGDGVKLADIPLTNLSSEQFIAHRPFLFFIYHIASKNILLEGRLNRPKWGYED